MTELCRGIVEFDPTRLCLMFHVFISVSCMVHVYFMYIYSFSLDVPVSRYIHGFSLDSIVSPATVSNGFGWAGQMDFKSPGCVGQGVVKEIYQHSTWQPYWLPVTRKRPR